MTHASFSSLPRRIRILLSLTIGLIILLIFHSLLVQNVTDYTYLIWNFALAALPVLWLYILPAIGRIGVRPLRRIVLGITAAIWLALLPNTFYLLTEFTHLNPHVLVNLPHNQTMGSITYGRGSAMYVLDSLMILLTALFGAYTGGVALWDAYILALKKFPRVAARVIISLLLLLVPIGVYIGRYGRWNSWDLITHPWQIITDFLTQLGTVHTRETFCVFCLTILLFELGSLYAVRTLALTDTTSQ